MSELIKALGVAHRIEPAVLDIEEPEAFMALIGATVDNWCIHHKYDQKTMWNTLTEVAKTIQEEYGDMEG